MLRCASLWARGSRPYSTSPLRDTKRFSFVPFRVLFASRSFFDQPSQPSGSSGSGRRSRLVDTDPNGAPTTLRNRLSWRTWPMHFFRSTVIVPSPRDHFRGDSCLGQRRETETERKRERNGIENFSFLVIGRIFSSIESKTFHSFNITNLHRYNR